MRTEEHGAEDQEGEASNLEFGSVAEFLVLKLIPGEGVRRRGGFVLQLVVGAHQLQLDVLVGFGHRSGELIITRPARLIQLNQMKLTTATLKNEKVAGSSNALLLKNMMQKAASKPVEHKSTYRIVDALQLHNLPKVPTILSKTPRCRTEPYENKENVFSKSNTPAEPVSCKLKVTTSQSVKNLQPLGKSKQPLIKSQSINCLQARKLKCLSKSSSQLARRSTESESFGMHRFRLGKKLGRGRFGNVFSAEDKETGFVLAIKIINKKQLKEAEMEDQLVSEIKLQSFMSHPNILSMYGFFHDDTNIYMMLELADECLFKMLRRKVCFPENGAAYYMRQVSEGLKYMHTENILHRDLKPENIMLVNNVVKLADFGWSIYSPLYKRQTFCGTLDYVSPEVVQGDYYDEAIDVWSLGILMYELTVGSAPFQGSESEEETFQKIVDGSFQMPSFLSKELKKLIKWSLTKDPKRRCRLQEIQESEWIQAHAKEGRNIAASIWQFWESMR